MKRFIIVLTAFVATFSLCPQLWAKTFYLKNGEEIEYQSYRQKNATIYLLINRDTEVEFPVNEVDLAKTVKAAAESKKMKHKLHAKRHSARKAVKHAVSSKQKENAAGRNPNLCRQSGSLQETGPCRYAGTRKGRASQKPARQPGAPEVI